MDRFITFAYVRPNMLAKCRFWENCRTFASSIQGPWIVLGDLNDIATSEEQWGSSSINNNLLEKFVESYSACGFLDMGASGPKFTWYRFAGNRVTQMRRLDRVLWNINAQIEFLEAKVVILPRVCSNHNPVLFIEKAGSPPNRDIRPSRFEAAWLMREDYNLISEEAVERSNRPFA
ncbi:uncharacterized protein LOC116015713 [Ipomoea triloba]|uniref:uncharacterized protein LOC116015713 n=1 Tax=Ipomoea triloba TaxID=35885 RepID=UPI00125E2A1C|nr:uncharacterized protein LOC116015713 [Ipomoea triloba]